MYQQNSSPGAKWLFWLAIVVMVVVFFLGFNFKDAKWLNGELAAAEAAQMNLTTETQRQNAEIDYLKRKAQIENDKAKQRQALEAQNTANIQGAEFRKNAYNALNFGLMLLMAVVAVVVAALGLYGSLGLYRLMVAKAKAVQVSQPAIATHQEPRRQRSAASIKARKRELRQRAAKVAIKNTKPFGTDQEFVPGKYPWAN